jgi:hypothetical protein
MFPDAGKSSEVHIDGQNVAMSGSFTIPLRKFKCPSCSVPQPAVQQLAPPVPKMQDAETQTKMNVVEVIEIKEEPSVKKEKE